MITVVQESPHTQDATRLLHALSEALETITGNTGEGSFDLSDMDSPRAVFAIARDEGGHAVGCGALRPMDRGTAEVKRVFAETKGIGVGSAILNFLETRARELGYTALRLETRKANADAVAFYLARGYAVIENYGKYRDRSEAVCFGKSVGPRP